MLLVAMGLEVSRGLWVELWFGDAFVYQTCHPHSFIYQVNMKNEIKALIFWRSSGGF
jgi:hypothetical protein